MESEVSIHSQRQVLFIASIFPPAGGPGVQRSAKFVRYLPGCGWKPIVLTVHEPRGRLRDDSLLAEIPPETVIVRARTLEPKDDNRSLLRYLIWGPLTPLSVPDMGNWWLPGALPAALRELRSRPISALYATGAPFSSHILAALLKARTGLPLLLDYRDEWTLNPLSDRQRRRYWMTLFRPWERAMQRWTVNKANRVILVTDSAHRAFVNAYGDAGKFAVIRNGYDAEDFEAAVAPRLSPDRLHIVYAGSTREFDSRPEAFLRGLRLAIERVNTLRDALQVHFIGEFDEASRRLTNQLGLETVVHAAGYVPHRESVGYLKAADALLLIAWSVPTRVPGKTYEYLAARKPVLALTPADAEPLRLFRAAGVATWCDPQDPGHVAEKLIELEEKWRQKVLQAQIDEDFVRSFERKRLTAQLARILDEMVR